MREIHVAAIGTANIIWAVFKYSLVDCDLGCDVEAQLSKVEREE